MLDLIRGLQSIVETCMELRPRERILIIADNEGAPAWIAQIAQGVISSLGAEAVLMFIVAHDVAGHEPPAAVAAAMKAVDAVLVISDRHGVAHTNARQEASEAGVRYYTMAQVQIDDIKRGVSAPDIRLIRQRTESIAQVLTEGNEARVTNPFGTSFTLSIAGREALAAYPSSRTAAGLPDYAEAAIAPVEGSAEGIVVADVAVVHWGYVLRQPLRFTVKAGRVVDISGSEQEVSRMRDLIATDENAGNLAELGIGSSHIMPWEIHGTRRDAGRLGTAHIAFGRNNGIGGQTWSRIHVDSLMSDVTVEVDGRCILRNGLLLI